MDINRLHHFSVVAQTVHLRQAAMLLGITPAALSKSLKLFQQELGIQLLRPIGRNIELTPEGKKLASKAKALLTQIDQVEKELKAGKSDREVLRFGSFEVFTTHFVAKALKSHFNENEFFIHEALPGQLEEMVLQGEIDFALSYISIPKPNLSIQKIATIEMGIYGHKNLVAKKDFSDWPFVVPLSTIERTPDRAQGLDGWPDHRYQRFTPYNVQLLETALGLASEGLAVGYFPEFLVKLYNEKLRKEFQLEKLICPYSLKSSVPIYLIMKNGQLESLGVKKFLKTFRQQLQV